MSGSVWTRITRSRPRPSPRSALIWTTVVFVIVVIALSVDRGHQSAAYRDGTAPQRHGVVVSAPTHRQLTCGRGNDGWQVDVSYTVAGTVHTGALPTCVPGHYPPGTFVDVWEERPGILTLSPPGRARHLLRGSTVVLTATWLLVSGLFYSRIRAGRARA